MRNFDLKIPNNEYSRFFSKKLDKGFKIHDQNYFWLSFILPELLTALLTNHRLSIANIP